MPPLLKNILKSEIERLSLEAATTLAGARSAETEYHLLLTKYNSMEVDLRKLKGRLADAEMASASDDAPAGNSLDPLPFSGHLCSGAERDSGTSLGGIQHANQ